MLFPERRVFMWGRKIVYILLVIITSYIALMYESPVPGVFLAFELLLPIALFALTWYHKKNVKVTIGMDSRWQIVKKK